MRTAVKAVFVALLVTSMALNVYCIKLVNTVKQEQEATKQCLTQMTSIIGDMSRLMSDENKQMLYYTHPRTIVERTREWVTQTGEFEPGMDSNTSPMQASRGSRPLTVIQPGSPGADNPAPRYRQVVASVSAYTAAAHENGGKDDGITASGLPAQTGHIAMDGIPFGTPVLVDSVGILVVTDRFGGDYPPDRVDLFMDDSKAALRFGRQNRNIYILD
jgi:3D (Asp-Asp-Asp) domain-containing protein